MKISGKNISMTRGDTESLIVKQFDKTGGTQTPAPFVTGDTVTMTVREDVESPIAFQTSVTVFDEHGWAVIPIAHSDTQGMAFGTYVYDIQLTRADGTVTTLVTISDFTLTEEVTY